MANSRTFNQDAIDSCDPKELVNSAAAVRRDYKRPPAASTTWTMLMLCLFITILNTPPVDATIFVGNYSFESMPGLFGLPWRPDTLYRAHLQFLPENPYLCSFPNNNNNDNNINNINIPLVGANETMLSSTATEITSESSLVVPTDGVPVALLALRGNCSFGLKAQVAAAYTSSHARIQFCIVYDDEPRSNLIAMQAVDYPSITANIHTLFVSLVTGLELRSMMPDQSDTTTTPVATYGDTPHHHHHDPQQQQQQHSNAGLLTRMNADSPLTSYYSPYNEGEQWLVAAMAGFFGFIALFGCLLVAVHAGYLPEASRIYFLNTNPGATAIRLAGIRALLTSEQVSQLTVVEHDGGPGEERVVGSGDEPCCSICMEEYEQGERLIELPCSHRFHHGCIEPWLTERHPTCPLCKFDMMDHFANIRRNLSSNSRSNSNSSSGGNDASDETQVCHYQYGAALLTRWIRMGWTPVATTNTEATQEAQSSEHSMLAPSSNGVNELGPPQETLTPNPLSVDSTRDSLVALDERQTTAAAAAAASTSSSLN